MWSMTIVVVFGLECGIRMASAGYAVFGMDYEGHGRSKGARCYIKKFGNIVNDCYDYYTSISGTYHLPENTSSFIIFCTNLHP